MQDYIIFYKLLAILVIQTSETAIFAKAKVNLPSVIYYKFHPFQDNHELFSPSKCNDITKNIYQLNQNGCLYFHTTLNIIKTYYNITLRKLLNPINEGTKELKPILWKYDDLIRDVPLYYFYVNDEKDPIVFYCETKHQFQEPNWKFFYKSFHWTVWTLLGLTLVLVSIVYRSICPLLEILGILIYCMNVSKKNKWKTLVSILALGFMIVSFHYEAEFTGNIIASNQKKLISNSDELWKNHKFIMDPEGYEFLLKILPLLATIIDKDSVKHLNETKVIPNFKNSLSEFGIFKGVGFFYQPLSTTSSSKHTTIFKSKLSRDVTCYTVNYKTGARAYDFIHFNSLGQEMLQVFNQLGSNGIIQFWYRALDVTKLETPFWKEISKEAFIPAYEGIKFTFIPIPLYSPLLFVFMVLIGIYLFGFMIFGFEFCWKKRDFLPRTKDQVFVYNTQR